MSSTSSHTSSSRTAWKVLDRGASVLNLVLVLAAVGVLVRFGVPYMRALMRPHPVALPSAMVAVDWQAPESSQYCVACHKQVSPAMAGLAVERGHSQNVVLDEAQRAAVETMGTVAGPGDTLICRSCHQLNQQSAVPFMLADTLVDSQLCQRCHPGHYARGTAHDLRQSAPDAKNLLGQTVAEGGPCSACHLSHSFAREITRSELDPEGYCLPCHSAYHPAAGHARTTMDHPESRCRECHDPHDATHGEFLKEPISELCLNCHKRYGDGKAAGMHPLGRMADAVPQALIDAGAHTMGDPYNLTCVVCHDTHEARHEALLHVTPEANHLCLMCHEDKLLEQSHGMVLPKHGQQPILTPEQQAVVAGWGNPVGPQGELLCISCHSVHGAEPNTDLLTFTPKYGETCVACHPAEEAVFGTSHDLRTSHADLPNDAGLTPIAAGACSACHLSHRFPRERVATPADPGGQCVSCHREGDCAGTSVASGTPHPNTACIECHDPHTRVAPKYLRRPAGELCTSCHEDHGTISGGPHDVRGGSDRWPAEATQSAGACLPCHVAHGGESPRLLRYADDGAETHDDDCLACHADAGWQAGSVIAAIHPQRINPEHDSPAVALVPADEAGNKRMGCRTCHNVHGGAEPQHLANVQPDQPSEELCLHCHTEKRLIRNTGHSAARLKDTGVPTESCKPCHAMHATPDGTWGQVLSPRFLMEFCVVPEGSGGAGCVPCLACHHPDGPAPAREVTTHPEVITMNMFAPEDPGYMPLYGVDGKVDPQGQVTCRTCHLSHGRLDLLRRLDEDKTLTEVERAQFKAQVRPFEEPNPCTTCHGASARTLFLYFHDKSRRANVELPGRATP